MAKKKPSTYAWKKHGLEEVRIYVDRHVKEAYAKYCKEKGASMSKRAALLIEADLQKEGYL